MEIFNLFENISIFQNFQYKLCFLIYLKRKLKNKINQILTISYEIYEKLINFTQFCLNFRNKILKLLF